MNNWYIAHMENLAAVLSEDVGAPELRNPNNSAIRSNSWMNKLLGHFKAAKRA